MPSQNQLIQQIQSQVAKLAQAMADAQIWYDRWLVQATETQQKKVAAAEKKYQQDLAQAHSTYEQQHSQLAKKYANILALDALWSANWKDSRWETWTPDKASAAPTLIRLGQLVERGPWHLLNLPALLPYIGNRSLVFRAQGASLRWAGQNAQSILLHLLATVPAGKIRFTFVDPIGLGQNVAPFMHLADYDELLVTTKAWTETQHIEQRLADLTEHIENVIQKYLRNQYATIEDYNAQAGEVAEAYRVLAVFNFPTNFSENAARRLISIMQNGPRCGVYTVVLVDTSKPLPAGVNIADPEHATVITWDGQRFIWQDEDFKDCLLELDEPPPAELFNRIVESVGKAANAADKVEVAFDKIYALFTEQRQKNPEFYPGLPKPVQPNDPTTWWSGETTQGLIAQLGRIGARQIQCLDLGRGTNHNALLAGRVGSGKSTLLHTMIASLILNYSPAEIELYLIDFKEVEFKTYATHLLPHARVVAIQSEREFSLSVLQRLDAELQDRKNRFNKLGAETTGIGKYRAKSGHSLPRVLLIVDEFQEFFAEDDTISAQCGQLLDRLARQGRAFGIHVLLGSQTLAGAYGLARSTMGQMAVRISLQCSEADSRLILAEDNPAARLLSRPGEAIYNSHDGMVGHNNIFQVAMITDKERDNYLQKVAALAQKRKFITSTRIFDGNAPANLEQLMARLAQSGSSAAKPSKMAAWLGDPIAIRDQPLTALFSKQSGSNLLIVGQSEETALSLLTAALLSFAAQLPANGATFYILDFGTADEVNSDYLTLVKNQLPHVANLGHRRQLPDYLSILATEVQRRLDKEGSPQLPTFLLIYGLQRARDLHIVDYSPSSEVQQLTTILRDGPEVGIHTLVWCDTMTSLERRLEQRTIREFVLRVALQMSEQDSSAFLDTPAAQRLGLHRALFYNEDDGRLEKFRPYSLPTPEWLRIVGAQLRGYKQ